ncbi:MAG: hypothetical protein ACM3WV_00760 [Bacillota bacterium]
MENFYVKIQNHINCAKDWLDKAAAEFRRDNKLKGELILSLAQAEVKHAWEGSLQGNEGVRFPAGTVKRMGLVSAAASIAVCLSLLGAGYYFSSSTGSPGKTAVQTQAQKPGGDAAAVLRANPDLSAPLMSDLNPSSRAGKKSEGMAAQDSPPVNAVKKTPHTDAVGDTDRNITELIDWHKLENDVKGILKGD